MSRQLKRARIRALKKLGKQVGNQNGNFTPQQVHNMLHDQSFTLLNRHLIATLTVLKENFGFEDPSRLDAFTKLWMAEVKKLYIEAGDMNGESGQVNPVKNLQG